MNEQQRAVVQQALQALIGATRTMLGECYTAEEQEDAITALRQLLEQPEPVQSAERGEPVALVIDGVLVKSMLPEKYTGHLYTTPPAQPAVPLTDEQANLLINGRGDEGDDDYVEPTGDGFGLTDEDLVKLIRRVEAHHGIGVKP